MRPFIYRESLFQKREILTFCGLLDSVMFVQATGSFYTAAILKLSYYHTGSVTAVVEIGGRFIITVEASI